MGRKVNLDDDLSVSQSGKKSQYNSQSRESYAKNNASQGNSRQSHSGRNRVGQGQQVHNTAAPKKAAGRTSDVYVIQSFNEMDVSDYSWFNKLTSGIPLGCSNYYTVSLVKEKGAAHGGRGGDLNAVIFGKIQFAQLANGKRVKVTGKNRQGRFEVNKLFDCDTGSYIKINSHWSPPGAKGSGNGGTFLLIAIAVIAFLLLLAFGAQYLMNLIGTAGNGVDWQQLLITVAVVVIIIAYLVFTRFQILRAPWMQKIIGVVLLVLILLYVPGGQTILACALMIWVLMKMLSNLFR